MKRSGILALLFLICTLDADAYVLKLNGSGFARRWSLLVPYPGVSTNVVNTNTHAVRYFLASDGYSTNNTAAELNAVRASFAQWQSVPGSYVKFEDAGLVSPPVDVNTEDNTNIVYWAKGSTIVNGGLDNIAGLLGVTFTTFDGTDNIIYETDIVFNGVEFKWFTDLFDTGNTNFFVEGVALHEIGHFIGLNHSPVGAATMRFAGGTNIHAQVGLSSDEVAATRRLYAAAPGSYGAVAGTVTKNGSPVFAAAVYIQDALSNIIAGTVTESDGTYVVHGLPSGGYRVFSAPLDPSSASPWLCKGSSIASTYSGADTTFLVSTSATVTVMANTTNTANFAVLSSTPKFRISRIRRPTTNPDGFSVASSPMTMSVGQSNYYTGVFSADLPTNGSLTITGDGLTLGAVALNTNFPGNIVLSVPISVSSNATPGMRSFIVHEGTNIALAAGYLEILPAALDYNFDGLDDAFQRTFFSLFTSLQASPGTDFDGDGMTNGAEFIAGTIPTNAASLLKMLSVSNGPSGTAVGWQSVSRKRYQVSARTNAALGSWQDIGSPVTAAGPTAQYVDTAATNAARLYRVQVLP